MHTEILKGEITEKMHAFVAYMCVGGRWRKKANVQVKIDSPN